MNDIDYIRRSCQLALKAKGSTSPNPLVGAVIVKGGKVIAEGWHRRYGLDHAEVVALKKAGQHAHGARMYVNLEPCHHYGRTPPCVDQIIDKGIKEVVIGMKDPNRLTNGKSIAKLRRAGVKTKVGILHKECEVLNEAFVKYTTKRLPFISVKSAQSLDGKIATANGHSKWITSETTRKYARKMRDEFDAILVGVDTVLKDDPRLSGVRKSKNLKKIVLDSSLRTPPKARLFSGAEPSSIIIATTDKAAVKKRSAFLKKGVQVIVCPKRDGKIDLTWLFRELAKREITSILVEGGAHVIGNVLKARLADKIYCYIAPIIVGEQKALSSVVGTDIENINRSFKLKNITLKRIGRDILLQGYFSK